MLSTKSRAAKGGHAGEGRAVKEGLAGEGRAVKGGPVEESRGVKGGQAGEGRAEKEGSLGEGRAKRGQQIPGVVLRLDFRGLLLLAFAVRFYRIIHRQLARSANHCRELITPPAFFDSRLTRLCGVLTSHEGCNWMVTPDEHVLCAACRHNRTIPDISNPTYRSRWQKIEAAKRRLIYTLINLSLQMPTAASGDGEPLIFDFLANPPDAPGAPKVMTGHDNGIITLSLVEADDAMREQLRVSMGEPYRTLLGHFRHECGHFYWDKLVRDGGKIDSCRAIFGDESENYEGALKRHYASGAPPTWQQEFVSAYATSHSWEDFAEAFAHYLHIVDTLETARAFGLHTRPAVPDGDMLRAKVDFDPHRCRDINQIIDACALTFVSVTIGDSQTKAYE